MSQHRLPFPRPVPPQERPCGCQSLLTGGRKAESTDSREAPAVINGPGSSTHSNDATPRVSTTPLAISIVVPTWNCADYLGSCVQSLLNQTVQAQLIVVDDASTDATGKLLERFGRRVQVIRQSQRRGANAARNVGLSVATGSFIAFADADNEYKPDWLERLLRSLMTDAKSGVAYCGYEKLYENGSKVRVNGQAWDRERLWWSNYIDMSSVVRRAAMPHMLWPEGFSAFDDWQLWLDLTLRGWTGTCVPDSLFLKRERQTGKTQQSLKDLSEFTSDIASIRRRFSRVVGLSDAVSVVIPARDCEDLTIRCIQHLAWFSGLPLHVNYVDNGSQVGVPDRIASVASSLSLSLDVIANQTNVGFTAAVNQGIRLSGGRHVLVLNNDCFVGPNCVEKLAWHLTRASGIAAIGPLTGDDGHQSLRRSERRAHTGVDCRIIDKLSDPIASAVALANSRRSAAIRPEKMVAFFCTLLHRDALSRHGLLDERLSSGLCADDEWCWRLGRSGWKSVIALDAYASHMHRTSFRRLGIDRESLHAEAFEVFEGVIKDADRRRHIQRKNQSSLKQ